MIDLTFLFDNPYDFSTCTQEPLVGQNLKYFINDDLYTFMFVFDDKSFSLESMIFCAVQHDEEVEILTGKRAREALEYCSPDFARDEDIQENDDSEPDEKDILLERASEYYEKWEQERFGKK
ncbi:MAG: hypothetical protein LBR22_11440 [Desulfovibrio sp.]|nr:hypothetical protein [Desulfovibrio sp.]